MDPKIKQGLAIGGIVATPVVLLRYGLNKSWPFSLTVGAIAGVAALGYVVQRSFSGKPLF